MTIGKKLYLGFGAILVIMLALFILNIFTVRREYNARDAVAATLGDVQTIEDVRFQMMENRLYLGNYLLSGDLRDEDRTNKGVTALFAELKEAENKASDANLRSALSQVDETEHNWYENFAKQLIAKRHQVDAGDTTVSDLQIFYLQHEMCIRDRYWRSRRRSSATASLSRNSPAPNSADNKALLRSSDIKQPYLRLPISFR